MALDRIDHEILAILQNEGRISNKELAARVDLAPSSCLERVRRLERTGIIRGYHARVDPHAAGIELEVLMMVQLERHASDVMRKFQDYVMSLPEVVHVFSVGGTHDFLIHVVVRDSDHLRDFAMGQMTTRREVSRVETMLIFEHHTKAALPMLDAIT